MIMKEFFDVYFLIGLLFAAVAFITFIAKPVTFRNVYVGKHMNYNVFDVMLICMISVPFWPVMLLLILLSQWKK